jgi:hypothetical protein
VAVSECRVKYAGRDGPTSFPAQESCRDDYQSKHISEECIMKRLSCFSIGIAAVFVGGAGLASAGPVEAPPLPRGSEKVKLHPGQNPAEIKRDKNAHERPAKNKQRDDALPPVPASAASLSTRK